ncbi:MULTISPECIES: hypothetical protein [Xenorhabdus]|uniref:hypothetical protein n=1 Tax=Xenorhabdus TaxID=626 RepID=UPI00064A7A36|nr:MULTISPECIES: hypothetical protein [Xenorhabdus]KLU14255.1 hypothetical protein AAY47_17305 [Xenorhabdus griffiniae]KOP34766.1 hypothetical protein AFK69_02710 [Xenorhabdus sp. GDc328]
MSTPVAVIQTHNASKTQEESIYHSASTANNYAIKLMDEIAPLLSQMEINHLKEAARFRSLIGELISMTSITKDRCERLINKTHLAEIKK